MFPSFKQRLILLAGFFVAIWPLWWAGGAWTTADGSSGMVLLQARAGVPLALLLAVLLMLPALAAGWIAGLTGHPLSGFFLAATTLAVLACKGGSTTGWLQRSDLPADYLALSIELALWQFWWILLLLGLAWGRKTGQSRRLPAWSFSENLGTNTQIGLPGLNAIGAGLICAVIGGALSAFLIVNARIGQVAGGLFVAFLLAGMIAQLLLPQNNPIPLLAAPLITGLASYLYLLLSFGHQDAVLLAWHSGKLPGSALALPIHYASIAIAGVAMGVGWAQGMIGTNRAAQQAQEAAPTAAGPNASA